MSLRAKRSNLRANEDASRLRTDEHCPRNTPRHLRPWQVCTSTHTCPGVQVPGSAGVTFAFKQKSRLAAVIFVLWAEPYAADLLIALMHLVQSTLCTTRPFSMTNVFCRLGL